MTTQTATKGLINTTLFSHGTMEVHDLQKSRKFYEEFLGLNVVQHHPVALMVRKNQYFAVVAVQMGDKVHPLHVLNHWGVDVPSRDDVDRAYKLAQEYKDVYGIKKIMPVTDQHGAYSFYLEDLDSNWWEVQHVADGFHDIKFAEGNITGRDAAGTREVEKIVRGAAS